MHQAEDGERELLMLSSGFLLSQNGKPPSRVVRRDKVLTSRF